MSKIALSGNSSGTGTLTLAAPNTNTDRTLTLPDASGTMMTTATSLDASQIPDGSITTAKIADANVTIAKLSTTGTPSSSTFLRGDGSWQSAGGGVTSLNGQTGAITNTDYGAIGSYTIAFGSQNAQYTVGSTIAGSSLVSKHTNPDGYSGWGGLSCSSGASSSSSTTMESIGAYASTLVYPSMGLSGTWRSVTYSRAAPTGFARLVHLWVRIS